jgi:CubicO group peptidase (beta-lactamase class C family)
MRSLEPSRASRLFWIPAFAGMTLFATATASAAPPADLDARVERAMKTHPQFQPPGLALAIVEDGKVTWAKGYGVKKTGETRRIDEHTIFPMGSCGKAFTAAALALLVDDGKLSWEDKVADRLPGFRLYDPYATAELTVRDLLVHRSGLGLGAGDLLTMGDSKITRKELVHQLRYIKPAHGFREKFAYDNVLYGAAGELIEAVSGQTWEAFVEKRIFGGLGMKDSTVDSIAAYKTRNHAVLHARLDGPMRGLGTLTSLSTDPKRQEPRATSPAGAIWSSASDIARWLQVQLGRGALPGGKRLYSEKQAQEMWTSVVLDEDSYADFAPLDARKPTLSGYALGWTVEDYRGHKVIQHSGFVLGGKAVVMLLPNRNVGIATMVNSEDGAPRWSLVYQLLDHYLGLPPVDWDAKYRETVDLIVNGGLEALKELPGEAGAAGTRSGPSLPLEKYAGVYRDPWYGTVTISQAGTGLRIQFDRQPSWHGPLEHVRYDTFRTRLEDRNGEDAYVTFALNPDGSIDQVKMKAVSPLADFSFNYHDLLLTPVARK